MFGHDCMFVAADNGHAEFAIALKKAKKAGCLIC